jgi:Putative peptidoglycan binding domain
MKTGLAISLATLALLAAPVSRAATIAGEFAVDGIGRAACSGFVEAKAKKGPELDLFMTYADGYLTAVNRYETDTFDITPWHTQGALSLILEKYCKDNPTDNFGVALVRLAVALRPLRLTDTSKLMEVVDGTQRAVLYVSVMQNAQTVLARQGLYRGQADGKFTPDMKTAILAFQKQSKLPLSGIPDPATLWFLLNP